MILRSNRLLLPCALLLTAAAWGASARAEDMSRPSASPPEGGALPWSEAPWDAADIRISERLRFLEGPFRLASPAASIQIISNTKGDGCLESVDTRLSASGDLTASFWYHELYLEPDQTSSQGLCRAQIVLESDVPLSFTVTRAYAQGFTVLDPGVEARLGLRYHGPGDDVRAPIERVVSAPGAGDTALARRHGFVLERAYGEQDQRWSPCSKRSEIELRTLFELHGPGGGHGWVDMCRSETEGRQGQAGLSLSFRTCEL